MFARRNRRKRLNTHVPPWSFGGGIALVALMGTIYVGMSHRCDTLGREIKALELERIDLNKKYVSAEYRWATLKSPQGIDAALAAHGMAMDWPQQDQIVRMDRAPRLPAPSAARGAGGVAWAR